MNYNDTLFTEPTGSMDSIALTFTGSLDSHRTIAIALAELDAKLQLITKSLNSANQSLEQLVTKNDLVIKPEYLFLLGNYKKLQALLEVYKGLIEKDAVFAESMFQMLSRAYKNQAQKKGELKGELW